MPALEIDFSLNSIWSPWRPGLRTGSITLRDAPQEVTRQRRPDGRSAVAEKEDDFVQVLYLQTVIERISKAMGPMEERKRAKKKEIKPREGKSDQGEEAFVARGLQPLEREGKA